jgi:hypothetical protein
MATVVNLTKKAKKDAFHTIFEPSVSGCHGACNYTWDSTTKQYVLDAGDACAGVNCQPCEQYKSSAVRELVMLEGSFPDPDVINYTCGVGIEDSFDAALRLYVDLLKLYRLVVKFTIGLGFLSAALLAAVVYLLVR